MGQLTHAQTREPRSSLEGQLVPGSPPPPDQSGWPLVVAICLFVFFIAILVQQARRK
jgi:hypothetical protein